MDQIWRGLVSHRLEGTVFNYTFQGHMAETLDDTHVDAHTLVMWC